MEQLTKAPFPNIWNCRRAKAYTRSIPFISSDKCCVVELLIAETNAELPAVNPAPTKQCPSAVIAAEWADPAASTVTPLPHRPGIFIGNGSKTVSVLASPGEASLAEPILPPSPNIVLLIDGERVSRAGGDVFHPPGGHLDELGDEALIGSAAEKSAAKLIFLANAPSPNATYGIECQRVIGATSNLNYALETRDEERLFCMSMKCPLSSYPKPGLPSEF